MNALCFVNAVYTPISACVSCVSANRNKAGERQLEAAVYETDTHSSHKSDAARGLIIEHRLRRKNANSGDRRTRQGLGDF